VAQTIPSFKFSSRRIVCGSEHEARDRNEIQRESEKTLRALDLIERLKTGGIEPVGSTPEEFDARFRADIAKSAKIVKDARIPMQD